MASGFMLNVNENFNLGEFTNRLSQLYRTKGYDVEVYPQNEKCVSMKFKKGTDTLKTILGMKQEITANIVVDNNTMMINFNDAEWTVKIIVLIVGLFVFCWILAVTAIIGIVQQANLPKNIENDSNSIAMQLK